ncbi:MAG: hypothetical protein K9J33_06050 [Bacteroidales bacterium]|nr:hypothetical protein [Bacteroidales bacterium]
MKKLLLTTLVAFLFPCLLWSQDIIFRNDGKDIESLIIEVGTENIKYKKFNNPNGPVYIMKKSEIFMIRYENGTKDLLHQERQEKKQNQEVEKNEREEEKDYEEIAEGVREVINANKEPAQPSFVQSPQNSNMCVRGMNDATFLYRGKNSGAGWTAITALVTGPVFGLIPAISCASTPPKRHNLGITNYNLISNPAYFNCYQDEAHRKKRNKVWGHYVLGALTWGLFVFIF